MADEPQPQPKPDDEVEGEQADDGMTPEERLANHQRLQQQYPNVRIW
ncbi:hypothetical protein [Streptomyces sp. NPDC021224]